MRSAGESDGAGVPEGDGSVDAVLLDAGNTLVFVDPVRTRRVLVRWGGDPDPDRFREAERRARLRLSERMGPEATGTEAQVWRDYFSVLFAGVGVPAQVRDEVGAELRALHAAEHLWSHVDPETPAALERLLAGGYRLAVVSNADGRVEALLHDCGLAGYFEFVIDSEVVHCEKPDRRIFDLAVARLGLDARQCLFVGDLYAVDVLGARAAGLQALLLDPFDHFRLDVDRVPSVAHVPRYLKARSRT